MLSFKQLMTEANTMVHAAGSTVAFPHKGVMTTGTIERHVPAIGSRPALYVIHHGVGEKKTIHADKVEKYGIFNEVFDPAFKRAVKSLHSYDGQINGKTYVVPHAFSDGDKTTPMRHAIVTAFGHIQHNNPTLTPEEHARVHQHIKDIHGGQESAKLEEAHTVHGTAQSYDDKAQKWTTDHRTYTVKGNNRKRSLTLALKKLQQDFPHHKEHEVNLQEEYEYPDPGPRGVVKLKPAAARPVLRNIYLNKLSAKKKEHGATKLGEDNMNEGVGVFHGVATYHQTKIAKQTLRMPDAMVGVMGGGSKEDARAHLKRVGWSDKQIHRHEHYKEESVLKERTLTGPESEKKEELVHHMKKNIQGFKERYGKDAKGVMYATATKQAKRLAEETHHEHAEKNKPARPCSASDMTFGGKCLNCGYQGKAWQHRDAAKTFKEEAEQILELSRATLKSYIKRAAPSLAIHSFSSAKGREHERNVPHPISKAHFGKEAEKSEKKTEKREKGIVRAAGKLEEARSFTNAIASAKQRGHKVTYGTASRRWHVIGPKDRDYNTSFALDPHAAEGHGEIEARQKSTAPRHLEEAAAPFMTTYKRNESANRHTANILHLARHFGDEGDRAQAKFYADELKKHGHNKHHEAQYELHKKLWPKAAKAHNLKEEVVNEEMQWQHGHLLHPEDQKHVLSAYVHRHTKEHRPQWAKIPMANGTAYKPHHNTDKDWLKNTQFAVKKNGRLNMNVGHARSTPSLPLNEEVHAYDVHHKGKHIDTIFYGHPEPVESVKKSLVNHDGYHPDITVKKQPKTPGQKLTSARWDAANKNSLKEAHANAEYPTDKRHFHTTQYKEHLAKSKSAGYIKDGERADHAKQAEEHRKAAGLDEASQTLKTVKKVLAEMSTRRHFQQVADLIKAHPDAKKRQELANHHAGIFASQNPRFSHERFHAASGTKYTKA